MIDRRDLFAAAVAAAFSAGALAAGDDQAKSQKQKQDSQARSQQSEGKQSASGGSSTGTSSKQAGSKQSGGGKAQANAPMIVLVPVTVASSNNFGNGCWARLYDDENFQGNQLSLIGPQDMSNMRTAFGTDWSGNFESIQVGPRATVTVYDNENYGEKAATFKPNQKVPELSDRMGFFEQVRSLKITCAGGQRSAQQGASQSGASAGSSQAGSGSSSAGSSK